MKVVYINHSGFMLEWENCYWIFDYYKEAIPELDPAKEIFVFSSHSHKDHFNPAVFALKEKYPQVTYILSNEIKQMYRKLVRTGMELRKEEIAQICGENSEKYGCRISVPEVQFLRSRNQMELADQLGNSMQIFGLQSTDCGCAFLITYQGKTIYHAGDLHWWHWSGEGDAFNKKMAADFKAEMRCLKEKELDLVFTPLDPRQGPDYALGMNYILQHAKVKNVFPMHFWNDYSVCEKYLEEYKIPEYTVFHSIGKDGQSWEIEC